MADTGQARAENISIVFAAIEAARQEAEALATLDAFAAKTGKPWALHVWRGEENEKPAFGVHVGNGGRDWSDGCLLYSATHTPSLARSLAAAWCRAELAK